MALFDSDYEEPKQPKVPTLRQFLRECTDQQLQQTFQVTLIWLPNRYNNFTLETHAFRLRVPEDTKLYNDLAEFCEDQRNKQKGDSVGIKVKDRKNIQFSMQPMKKRGSWSLIGDNGLKWTDP